MTTFAPETLDTTRTTTGARILLRSWVAAVEQRRYDRRVRVTLKPGYVFRATGSNTAEFKHLAAAYEGSHRLWVCSLATQSPVEGRTRPHGNDGLVLEIRDPAKGSLWEQVGYFAVFAHAQFFALTRFNVTTLEQK